MGRAGSARYERPSFIPPLTFVPRLTAEPLDFRPDIAGVEPARQGSHRGVSGASGRSPRPGVGRGSGTSGTTSRLGAWPPNWESM